MKTQYKAIILSFTMLFAASCVPEDAPEPLEEGPSGEEPAEVDPCASADFENDNYNCGACGVACQVLEEGTRYEAGGCESGVCGPTWASHVFEVIGEEPLPAVTCEEVCGVRGVSCAVRGCSGLTGYLCSIPFDSFGGGLKCGFWSPPYDERLELTGECGEPLPPVEFESGVIPYLNCCCNRPNPPPGTGNQSP